MSLQKHFLLKMFYKRFLSFLFFFKWDFKEPQRAMKETRTARKSRVEYRWLKTTSKDLSTHCYGKAVAGGAAGDPTPATAVTSQDVAI